MQSQDLLSEIRAANVLDRFQDLRMEIDYWEYELKSQCLTFEEINEHSNSLIKNLIVLGKKRLYADRFLNAEPQCNDLRGMLCVS